MYSPGSYFDLHSIRESSEEHQPSPVQQHAQQQHYGSGGGTSNPTSIENMSWSGSPNRNIGFTAAYQSLTSGSDPHNGYESKPWHQQQLSEQLASPRSNLNHRYHVSISMGLGPGFDGAGQFRNRPHQSPVAMDSSAYGVEAAIPTPSESMSLYRDSIRFTKSLQQDAQENLHGYFLRPTSMVPEMPAMSTVPGQVDSGGTVLGNDDPWSAFEQRRYRNSAELMPQLEGRQQIYSDVYGGPRPGESAYCNFSDPTRSLDVSAFNRDVGDLIQNNQQTGSGGGNWQANGFSETTCQPQIPQHGYHRELAPPGDSLARVDSKALASSSGTRSPPSTSTRSTTLDPLLCSLCTTRFHGKYRKGNFARHMRLKHGLSPKKYICASNECNCSFARKDARLKHSRKKHAELHLKPAISRKNVRHNTVRNPVSHRNEAYNHGSQSFGDAESLLTDSQYTGPPLQHDDDLLGLAGT
ncbi:hypothetical protein ACJQWK_05578 [Exserohilum turcicum]